MAKDQFGIDLQEGTRVVVKLGSEMVNGIITKIEEGGLSLIGNGAQGIKPGHLVVLCDVHYQWNPQLGDRLANVIVTMDQPSTCSDPLAESLIKESKPS